MAQDRKLAAELVALLEEMGPELEVIQQMEEGRRVTGLEAEQMSGGRARVRQYWEGRGRNRSEDRSYWTSTVANCEVASTAQNAATRTCPKRFASTLSAEQ